MGGVMAWAGAGRHALDLTVRLTSARSVGYVRELVRRLRAASGFLLNLACRGGGRVLAVIDVAARRLLHPAVHDEPVPQIGPRCPTSASMSSSSSPAQGAGVAGQERPV